MKSPDDLFANQFGIYELREYAYAFVEKDNLNRIKEQRIQELYDDCDPSLTRYNEELGVFCSVSVNVENMAIHIIDTRERFDRMIKRYRKKADVFALALESLTPREKDVIFIQYFNRENNLGLSPEYFNDILTIAEEKMCNYIVADKEQERLKRKELRKQEIRHKVQEWKQAN
jgi:hypothetical protein